MKRTKTEFISSFLLQRANIVEIILVSMAVGVGVNLLSSAMASSLNVYIYAAIGALLCTCSCGYLIFRIFSGRKRTRLYEGFLEYDSKNNCILSVDRYWLAEQVSRFLNSGFSENHALKTLWDKQRLVWKDLFDTNGQKLKFKSNHSVKLIREVLEYSILEALSLHLSSYFSSNGIPSGKLTILKRSDVSDVVLSNKFLEMFSKPMEERSGFADSPDSMMKAVYANGKGGELYNRFEIMLPQDSKLIRIDDKGLLIRTTRFDMIISIEFLAMNSNLPRYFEKYYMHRNDFDNLHTYEVKVNIDVKFNFLSLMFNGWDYYQWVDSFLSELDDKVSKDVYFENIGWENAKTIIECMNTQPEKERSRKSSSNNKRHEVDSENDVEATVG